ncbi:MAG: hypothetical protein Ct9H300mP28_08830 [Pseudomonadota bacterium]|nr:MAG: hypothetical protein Ct9H300mP28_08830 [Pseudomonadota bacterium]
MEIRILSSDDVRKALPMKEAISGMKRAFSRLFSRTGGNASPSRVPLLTRMVSANYACCTSRRGGVAVKLVTVFGKNPGRGFPLIHAAVIALDIKNGESRH